MRKERWKKMDVYRYIKIFTFYTNRQNFSEYLVV
jgi:hypothetical protein